ncbi:MAG TPA: electron transfer flavoprotein subunit alpha [Acholeplasmataceae bacterium]|nr:electron transfer flavoprotein subunit alpha [Acholeplasmataceae bacterium]
MAKILVDQSKVRKEDIEPSIKICPFNAIEYTDGILQINSGCKMCKICVRKGPNGIFSLEEDKIKIPEIDKSKWVGITVFVEHSEMDIHPVALELIGKAKELAKVINHPVYALLFADNGEEMANTLLEYGVDKVYLYENKYLQHFNVEHFTNTMEDFINKVKPSVILYGGTSIGRSFAPRVAARFKTGLTADCTILDMKENTDLIQNRPAFGGNIMAGIICTNHRPQMATVRYKIFKMPEKEESFGEVVKMETNHIIYKTGMRLLEIKNKPKEIDISEAEVIVAIGKCFKTKEQIKMAQELADLLDAQLACTRPVIEAGLMDTRRQIGLSGRTVSPKLLITLGVGGAVQFTAGMTGSEIVFAICDNKKSAIFDACQYGIVGDVYEIVPQLIKEIKKFRGLV